MLVNAALVGEHASTGTALHSGSAGLQQAKVRVVRISGCKHKPAHITRERWQVTSATGVTHKRGRPPKLQRCSLGDSNAGIVLERYMLAQIIRCAEHAVTSAAWQPSSHDAHLDTSGGNRH